MSQITVITGRQSSGKTSLAMEMSSNKNAIWASNFNYQLLKDYLTDETQVIILDEIQNFTETIRNLEFYMRQGFVLIRKPFTNFSISFPFPEIILVMQKSKESLPVFIQENSNFISL